MTDTRPTAVGYVSARDAADLARQREAVTSYAKAEGLRLVETVRDPHNGWTISQLVTAAAELAAACVLIPAGVHLAEASARVSADLAGRDARCVVVDVAAPSHTPESQRPAARLPTAMRRRAPIDANAPA